jgi:carbamoyltransferase
MIVWGTSFGSHDAALSVIDLATDRIVFASHSERFSGRKDDPNLCQELIDHAVTSYGLPHKIFYYENPWKKKLRYLASGQIRHIFEDSPKTSMVKLGIDAPIHYVDHHHSHAAAGYYTSGYSNATIVVVDAIGELATLTIWDGVGTTLTCRYQQDYPHSLGLFYSAMTEAAGFKPVGEEYIFMGKAAYGDPSVMSDFLQENFLDFDNNRRIVGLRHNLHAGARHLLPTDISPEDLAAGAQHVYELALHRALTWAWQNLSSSNLVLMGGCALNCVANTNISKWHGWRNVWIMPNPGDAGSAIGAVLARTRRSIIWDGPYLGYEITGDYPIKSALSALNTGGIAAVANGRAEFGPRALGNRSILADPRIPDIKLQMNWLKKRDQFRPFAAAIPEHLAHEYFVIPQNTSSPYMQYVFEAKDRSRFPGMVHVDGTSRIQTVNHQQHPKFYQLLMEWYNETGCPMLINTSLNIKNQPLVNTEQHAQDFGLKYGIPVLTRDISV